MRGVIVKQLEMIYIAGTELENMPTYNAPSNK